MPTFFRKKSSQIGHDERDPAGLAALIARVAEQQPSALEQLYDATVQRVYGLALRILHNAADAEEVCCDVYQQIWRNARRFDTARGSALQWIMVIARSRALDSYRGQRLERAQVRLDEVSDTYLTDENPAVDQLLGQIESASAVRAAVALLSPDQARLIGLAFFQGLSHQEIAERTKLPLGTVKSHILRGIQMLRKSLATSDLADA